MYPSVLNTVVGLIRGGMAGKPYGDAHMLRLRSENNNTAVVGRETAPPG